MARKNIPPSFHGKFDDTDVVPGYDEEEMDFWKRQPRLTGQRNIDYNNELKKLRISPIPSPKGPGSVFTWIRNGGEQRSAERIKIVRSAQRKFIGQRVSDLTCDRSGTVIYITRRPEVRRTQDMHPLDVCVRWDSAGTTAVNLKTVKLISK
ncbi:MAG: hypothetical protein V1846_02100 [Candidatus Komeilibacteria bacterium]